MKQLIYPILGESFYAVLDAIVPNCAGYSPFYHFTQKRPARPVPPFKQLLPIGMNVFVAKDYE
ncbi:hypothetical protein ET464_05400 [Paenibacillus protaetiae]|uniref:Uncharacterized protein n=1 Tax=Paenibacillus protaetiae TaxID=2509456 RepID=A0A4P6EUT9_9BACL|nr:hypothetical protein ET464_05400 [Paenibacillus protaetiae]